MFQELVGKKLIRLFFRSCLVKLGLKVVCITRRSKTELRPVGLWDDAGLQLQLK
jgi:hypothetical protein